MAWAEGEFDLRQTSATHPATRDTVLLVEDDEDVRETVRMMLEREGFVVKATHSIGEAERILDSNDVRLALVDLLLHGEDGLRLVRSLADVRSTAVVIMSGKTETTDRVIGIELGADDYITKPFNSRELVARVKRHAGRVNEHLHASPPPGVTGVTGGARDLRIGRWRLDEASHAVLDERGREARLSDSEFRTLVCLLQHRGTVLTRDALFRQVVGSDVRDPLDRRIDVHVSSIRRKLRLAAGSGIRTVHRVGYVAD